MASEWVQQALGDFITLQRGYDLPTQDRHVGSVPIVSSSGVSGSHSEARVAGPGVVTGRYGTIGQVFYIDQDFWPLNTTLFVSDFHGNDPLFASYLLRTVDFASCSDKSSVPGVNRNDLHRLKVITPSLPEQRAIAYILGTLDDKIELNSQMNQTLEAMAQALFKSWFVDFDPVRSKASGRQPVGMDAATAALFPDGFDVSELGQIPRGWLVQPLSEHIEVVRGLSYKGSGLSVAGMPLHNLNSIYEGGGYKHAGIKFYIGEYQERHLIKVGDVIVANTEQGHDKLLIGYPAIIPPSYKTGLFSHHLYRVRPRGTSYLTPPFLYFLLQSRSFHETVASYTNGTTVNMLPIDALERPLFVMPSSALLKRFDEIVSSILLLIEQNRSQGDVLATIRDTLMPKLLSGEVRVSS